MIYLKNISTRIKLIALLLLIGITPMLVNSYINFKDVEKVLDQENLNKLNAVMTTKKNQIEVWLKERVNDIHVLVSFPVVVKAMININHAYISGGVNSKRYKQISASYDSIFRKYKNKLGYYDLFLISKSGNVVYTVEHEDDFNTNLIDGKYKATPLAQAYRESMEDKVVLTDFGHYNPSNGNPASFIASPIKNDGKVIGIAVMQIPIDAISKIMHERTGLGDSGETYLVGNDFLMRSDSRFVKDSTILKKEVKTIASKGALEGKSECSVILDYRDIPVYSCYAKLKNKYLDWVILSEIDEAEALKSLSSIRNATLLITVLFILAIIIIAVLIASIITQPLIKLVRMAEKIQRGQYDVAININRGDEIGVLVKSFKKMISEIHKKNKYLKSISETDNLTNIHNRRYFDNKIKKTVKIMCREKKPLSVIFCDIDFFKQYNDTYGHTAGDICLQNIAEVMSEQLKRPGDNISRYGGEEFVVLLPNTSKQGAIFIAENIRKAVEDLKIDHTSSHIGKYITISQGLTTFIPESTTSVESYIKTSDKALYKAKEAGRNKCIWLQIEL